MAETTRYLAPSFAVDRAGDIAFGQARNEKGILETLTLDVYLPHGDTQALRPAIMWVHGGGFTYGNDKRQRYVPMFADAFAARGYVGFAPDYRVRTHPEDDRAGALRDAVQDIRMALQWLRVHSSGYGVDPSHIALAGGSAGGMTVIALVNDPAQPIDSTRDGVFALLDMWGSLASTQRPFVYVNPSGPPTLLIHGTADKLVPYQNSLAYARELEQAGVPQQLLTLPDAPHTPLMHFEQIVATMTGFLHQHLGLS